MTKSLLKIANKLINIINNNNNNKNTFYFYTPSKYIYFCQLDFIYTFNLKSMNSCKRFENGDMKQPMCSQS